MADSSDRASNCDTSTNKMPLNSVSDDVLQQRVISKNDSGDEYSSGSDRSMEAENIDEQKCDENNSNGIINDEVPGKIRSKNRHGSHSHSSRRHKGGSRHKPRSSFHPYNPDVVGAASASDLEMSLKRKSLDIQEKENAAAVLRQEGGSTDPFITFPVAPFNSTQFLMEEHSSDSPKIDSLSKQTSKEAYQDLPSSYLPSTLKNDADDLGPLINLSKKDQEFSDIYTSIHAENLKNMPKEELIKHYISLEEQVAVLQKRLAESEARNIDLEAQQIDLGNDDERADATAIVSSPPSGGNDDASNSLPVDEECGPSEINP